MYSQSTLFASPDLPKADPYTGDAHPDGAPPMFSPSKYESGHGQQRGREAYDANLETHESSKYFEYHSSPEGTQIWLKPRRFQDPNSMFGLVVFGLFIFVALVMVLVSSILMFPFGLIGLVFVAVVVGIACAGLYAYLKMQQELEITSTRVRYGTTAWSRRFENVLDVETRRITDITFREVLTARRDHHAPKKVGLVLDSGVTVDVFGDWYATSELAEADWLVLKIKEALGMDV